MKSCIQLGVFKETFMKKFIRFVSLFLCVITLFCVGACKKDSQKQPTPNKNVSISFDVKDNSLELVVYQMKKLTVIVQNSVETPTWTSSNEQVAMVSNEGMITAKTAGTAEIVAKIGNVFATCYVTVSDNGDMPYLDLLEGLSEVTKAVGDAFTIPANVKFLGESIDADIQIVSSNTNVLSVEGEIINALTEGFAELTLSSEYQGVKVSQTVKVTVIKVI